MSLPPEERGTFRRNVIIIAVLHAIVIGGLWLFSAWKGQSHAGENIAWLDGGGLPAGGGAIASAHASPAEAEETPDEDDSPTPAPAPTHESMQTPEPEGTVAPSLISIPRVTPIPATPTPEPTARPTPRPTITPEPTPKETPEATPRPTPKATPKPKPKHSATPKPKPKASASPRKHSSPKPSPKSSPKAAPHKSPADDGDDSGDDNATQAAKATFRKATGHTAGNGDESGGGGDGDKGTRPGTGGGNRSGEGHAGGGETKGDFGWYNSMLHDRFYSRWDQPTSIVTATSKFSTVVKIRIEKDGTISDVSLASSSGNDVMDKSVMEAARRVTAVDPLPKGLGEGGAYEVKINFELSQESQ